jgi:hypothetical protein
MSLKHRLEASVGVGAVKVARRVSKVDPSVLTTIGPPVPVKRYQRVWLTCSVPPPCGQ